MIKVGCAGFSVGRDRYWRSLTFVEADTGKGLPKPETLAGWRKDMPRGAEASVQASRFITHGPEDRGFPVSGKRLALNRRQLCGAFRESLEVHEAWMGTRSAAEALGARVVVFETPPSFLPGSDRLRDFYRFFQRVNRGALQLVWQPRGREWANIADKICAELKLTRAFDPLAEPPPRKAAFLYMRPRLPRMGSLGVDNMATIFGAAGSTPGYLVLSHMSSFKDCERLLETAKLRR